MPVKDGLAATREIAQADAHVQVLVLTSFPDDDNVYAAIKAGAMGFLLKDSSAEYLLDAIRTVARWGKRASSNDCTEIDAGDQAATHAAADNRASDCA